PLQNDGVFRREAGNGGKPGKNAEGGPACLRGDVLQTAVKEGNVAAKLVNEETSDERPVLGLENGMCADKACDDAAAIDVADQDHGQAGFGRETHIGDVALSEIGF